MIEVKINITIHIGMLHINILSMLRGILFLSKSTFRQHMALLIFDFAPSATSVGMTKICHSRIQEIIYFKER